MKKYLEITLLISLLAFVAFMMYYRYSPDEPISLEVKGESVAMVSHASFFTDKNAAVLEKLSEASSAENIILLSVNHYDVGNDPIVVKNESFSTSGGDIATDSSLAQKMIDGGIAKENDAVFLNEHGINNILQDIKRIFPKKKLLAVSVKDTTSKDEVDGLIDYINSECSNCLVVGSVDCSHDNPGSLAKVHDAFTLSALHNMDEGKAWQAETDSPQISYLMVKVAKQRGFQSFDLSYNANTDEISEGEIDETTSVIIGSFSKQEATPKKVSTFVLAGDVMLDRLVNHMYGDDIIDLSKDLGKRVFWGSDLRMLNLEGPVSKEPIDDNITVNNLVFNFPPASIDLLNYWKINTVSLANNHTLNAGEQGFSDTLELLNEAGIDRIGKQNLVDSNSVTRIDADIPMSVIGINLLSNQSEEIIELVAKEKGAGQFVIVFPHWGNEYATSHNAIQHNQASEWVTAGADLIVGSHPHVVQDVEVIDGVPVIYSLGNFIFDQTFSDETQQGLIVAGIITEDDLTLSILPTKQIDLRPRFEVGDDKYLITGKIIDSLLSDARAVSRDTILIKR